MVQRVVELVALLGELFAKELNALVHALPSTLDAFRDVLLAMLDACFGFFAGDDRPLPLRKLSTRRRLTMISSTVNDMSAQEPTSHKQDVEAALSGSGVDVAHVRQLLGRVGERVRRDQLQAHAISIASELQAHLESATSQVVPTDDISVSVPSSASIESAQNDDHRVKSTRPSLALWNWSARMYTSTRPWSFSSEPVISVETVNAATSKPQRSGHLPRLHTKQLAPLLPKFKSKASRLKHPQTFDKLRRRSPPLGVKTKVLHERSPRSTAVHRRKFDGFRVCVRRLFRAVATFVQVRRDRRRFKLKMRHLSRERSVADVLQY